MKKLFAFAFIALSLFSSCSSDDSVNVTEEKLTKKWYYKSYQANGTTEVYEHQSCTKDYMEFIADGSYKESYVQTCSPLSIGTSTGNWTLDGNEVFIVLEGESYSGKITSISDTKLQITVVADYDDDGDDENIKANFTSI